jgi:hypothetical protein
LTPLVKPAKKLLVILPTRPIGTSVRMRELPISVNEKVPADIAILD